MFIFQVACPDRRGVYAAGLYREETVYQEIRRTAVKVQRTEHMEHVGTGTECREADTSVPVLMCSIEQRRKPSSPCASLKSGTIHKETRINFGECGRTVPLVPRENRPEPQLISDSLNEIIINKRSWIMTDPAVNNANLSGRDVK